MNLDSHEIATRLRGIALQGVDDPEFLLQLADMYERRLPAPQGADTEVSARNKKRGDS